MCIVAALFKNLKVARKERLKMTNEEWMKSLATKNFVRLLKCDFCPENPHDYEENCSGNCEAFIEWLQTERKVENV